METMNPNDAGMQPVKLRSLIPRGARVPLNFTLGTSAAIVRTVPLLLVDLVTDDGVTFGFPCGEPFALGRWCARHL